MTHEIDVTQCDLVAVEDTNGNIYCTHCIPASEYGNEEKYPVLHSGMLLEEYPTIACDKCNKGIRMYVYLDIAFKRIHDMLAVCSAVDKQALIQRLQRSKDV